MYSPRRSNEVSSPPLHHPVPQHPIPPFRSPPPNVAKANPYVPQAQNQWGQGQQQPQQQGPGDQGMGGYGAYSNIFSDPQAQIGIEVGRNALNYGQQYLGKNINQYVSMNALKYYFQVSNSYVLHKILLVLFPWRHKPWSRQLQRSETGQVDQVSYATARDDINAPDMYIPVMSFTTYILLTSVVAGLHGTFHPKILGYMASKAIAFMFAELILLKIGTYLLSAGSKLLDFVAYSGYKFIGVTLTMLVSSIMVGSTLAKWGVFLYTASSNSFFLLRSLRYVLLPDSSSASYQTQAHTITSGQRQRRIQFLFFYSFVCQFFLMWVLVL